MAFTALKGTTAEARRAVVSATICKSSNNTLGLLFQFGTHLCDDLGWREGDMVTLLEGNGKDRGCFLLREPGPGERAYRLNNPNFRKQEGDAPYFRITVSTARFRHQTRPLVPHSLEECAHEVRGKQLFVAVPFLLPQKVAAA